MDSERQRREEAEPSDNKVCAMDFYCYFSSTDHLPKIMVVIHENYHFPEHHIAEPVIAIIPTRRVNLYCTLVGDWTNHPPPGGFPFSNGRGPLYHFVDGEAKIHQIASSRLTWTPFKSIKSN